MNPPNVFVLGFLLLTANLSFGALFSPAWRVSRPEDRVLRVFQMCILATVEIAAWALVLYQGGASAGPVEALKTSLAWFTQVGWLGEKPPGSVGVLSYFIAVNGVLFVPFTLLPLVRRKPLPQPEEVVLPASFQNEVQALRKPAPVPEQPTAAPKLPPKLPSQRAAEAALAEKASVPSATLAAVSEASNAPQFLETPVGLNPLGAAIPPQAVSPVQAASATVPSSSAAPGAATSGGGVGAGPGPELQRGGFRPKIPKAIRPDAELSPEEILAEQMKPVGPTPPPIRFGWKN
jgi:hypothetical protein